MKATTTALKAKITTANGGFCTPLINFRGYVLMSLSTLTSVMYMFIVQPIKYFVNDNINCSSAVTSGYLPFPLSAF